MQTDELVEFLPIFKINEIRTILYDEEDEEFYLVANKKNELLGFFVIKFKFDDPTKFEEITVWRNKLQIGDVTLRILRGKDNMTGSFYKELIIGYKTIFMNTYTVCVQDLSRNSEKCRTLCKHESFHLWETNV